MHSLSPDQSIASGAETPRLLLLLAAAGELYAIASHDVVEVIPRVVLRPISGAPPHRAGVFNFRGQVVPVVDVAQLIGGSSCAEHLSSRIIMIRQPPGEGGGGLLGLLAERVTDTLLKPIHAFQLDRPDPARPWLGGVAHDERGLIQLLHTEALVRLASADQDPASL